MAAAESPADRRVSARLRRLLGSFLASPVGPRVRWLFAALLLLLVTINGLNVLNSFVGRDFMTSLARREVPVFVRQAFLYMGVFAMSTLAEVTLRFTEQKLALTWREWLSVWAVEGYLRPPVYHRLAARFIANGEAANPDQRIADDVRTFTTTTLSFLILLVHGGFTIVAFSGVAWSISPSLFLVALLYAGAGSALTILRGRSLVRLNVVQLDREADFRAELLHVREHAEAVAFGSWEGHLLDRLRRSILGWKANQRRIIDVQRRVGFLTTGYNYSIQIIPALVVAPLFIQGRVEFGVVTQSSMAFAQLAGAFSLIVTQFQAISTYAAAVSRLGALEEAMHQAGAAVVPASEVCPHERRTRDCPLCSTKPVPASVVLVADGEEGCPVAYDRVTLLSPTDGRALVRGLTASLPCDGRVLLRGPDDAKAALFRATAGTWEAGEGRITRPAGDRVLFLTDRPYLPPGTLREVLGTSVPEHRIREVLRALDLESVPSRIGGLDAEQRWESALSLAEQQRMAVVRVLLARPRLVFFLRLGAALGPELHRRVLGLLAEEGIGVVTDEEFAPADAVLEIPGSGAPTSEKGPARGGGD